MQFPCWLTLDFIGYLRFANNPIFSMQSLYAIKESQPRHVYSKLKITCIAINLFVILTAIDIAKA
jgi:hypothetical protein